MDIESFTMRGLPIGATDLLRVEEMQDCTSPNGERVKARLFMWRESGRDRFLRKGWFAFDDGDFNAEPTWYYIGEEI
jgi:hypothetical protein